MTSDLNEPSTPAISRRTLVGGGLAIATGATGISVAESRRAGAEEAAPARPNIVMILADDLGFSDVGCFGSEVPTPNLDALAGGGLRFSQFYNCARCSPSRASLLTGLYPHQAGMGALDNIVKPESRGTFGRLLDRSVTLAEVLGSAGYHTSVAGKWHVGLNHGTPPWARGFQRSFVSGGGTYFRDQKQGKAHIDGRPVPLDSDEVGQGYWYGSDLQVDWATTFIDDARRQQQPFFHYLPFCAPHFPLMAPPEDIARFKGRYLDGWEPLRAARFERQRELGIIDPSMPLSPALRFAYDWSKLNADHRERFDIMMAVYAAAVFRLDRAIGDLVQHLKNTGTYENTLIIFVSDNGGNAEAGPDGRTGTGTPGSAQSDIWVGLNWAILQNTPFSYFKHYTSEGGIATPLIAHWPRGIDPAVHGTIRHEPGHLIDIMPTLAEVGGAGYPAEFNGHAILPAEGRSFAPAFQGQPLERQGSLYWEHEGNRAVRNGNWKFVARFQERRELYDLSTDRTETHNVADDHPDRTAELARQYRQWAQRTYVDPWDKKILGGVVEGSLG